MHKGIAFLPLSEHVQGKSGLVARRNTYENARMVFCSGGSPGWGVPEDSATNLPERPSRCM